MDFTKINQRVFDRAIRLSLLLILIWTPTLLARENKKPPEVVMGKYDTDVIFYFVSQERVPLEASKYMQSLPADSISKIFDMLNTKKIYGGGGIRIYSLAFAQMMRFEEESIDWNRNEVMPKVVRFLDGCLEAGHGITVAFALSKFPANQLYEANLVTFAKKCELSDDVCASIQGRAYQEAYAAHQKTLSGQKTK